MYHGVDDDFANRVNAGLNAVVEVVYRDIGIGNLNVQYDSTDAAYRAANPVTLENSGEWRTARFYLDDAFFGNRQNGGADFRLTGTNIPIDKVRVLRSFGDLMPPKLQAASATVNAQPNSVEIAWSMSDDWKSGLVEQWTEQEDNRVMIEWSNDSGSTWNLVDEVYEQQSANAQSGFNTATGQTEWSDEYAWNTAGLASGTYQVRVTPTDGRGNEGQSLTTMTFELTAAPAGDFDNDGDLDGDDIDLLVANIALGPADPATFDVTNDGNVDLADRDQWLVLAGAMNLPSGNPYLTGDANLDGVVDVQDFNAWNRNKFTAAAAWTSGDFSADGVVDVQDFNVWNSHRFQSANGSGGDFSSRLRDMALKSLFEDDEREDEPLWLLRPEADWLGA